MAATVFEVKVLAWLQRGVVICDSGLFGSVLFICKVFDWLMCGQYSCVLLIRKKVFDWLMCGLFSSVTLLICKKVFDWLMCSHFSGALLICKMVCPVFECT